MLQHVATWHQEPVARPGMSGMCWGPHVWAGVRPGDARSFWCKKTRYTLQVGFGCLRSSSSKTHAQLDCKVCNEGMYWEVCNEPWGMQRGVQPMSAATLSQTPQKIHLKG